MMFESKSEDQIKQEKLWPIADYPFEVMACIEKKDRKGGPMFEMKLELTNQDGKRKVVYDYLTPKLMEKLCHASKACGVFDQYLSGSLGSMDFFGKKGRVKLGIQKADDEFDERNKVIDYVCSTNGSKAGNDNTKVANDNLDEILNRYSK